jgi:hypothetical protein
MSGMFFDDPAVRFSRRLSHFQIRMRCFVTLLRHWLTGANRLSVRIDSRRHVAEFPTATQIAYRLLVGTLRGSRARDRASTDALRPNNNWVKPEDQYDISIIWEKWPTCARRLPQKERQSLAPPERAIEGAGEENSLAEVNIVPNWRKTSGQANAATGSERFWNLARAA